MRPLVFGALLLAGCATTHGGMNTAHTANTGEAPGAPADVPSATSRCETGRVTTFGPAVPAQRIVLAQDAVHRVELTGDSVGAVGRLTGATVTVCGPTDEGGRLRVDSFELREVDGMEAYLGTLHSRDQGFVLDPGKGRPGVPLADVPQALRNSAGKPVWVAGEWRGGAFAVRSFGILAGDRE